ncbi:hypothetical protein [Hyalangium minutum]|uniref:hypothetical protein n=1 Tax=Hyalangium minutum TaxID=394096 RepID=UPI0005C68F8F|nr:hypothetical protein [Hyalangium minutum]
MSPARLVLCLTLLVPGLGFAQTSEEWTPYTPPATEALPPPPLVPAEPPPPPPPAETPPKGELIPRRLLGQRGEPDQSALRLVIMPWSSVIMGLAGAIVGTIPTAILALPVCATSDEKPACGVAIGASLSVSYAVGVTLGVSLVGRMTGGEGDGLVTFFAALAGSAVGAGIGVATQSTAGLILGLTLTPVLFAVTAYELTHSMAMQRSQLELQARSKVRLMPVVSVTPQGGLLGGLAGRF